MMDKHVPVYIQEDMVVWSLVNLPARTYKGAADDKKTHESQENTKWQKLLQPKQ